jgi:hypothetical protein
MYYLGDFYSLFHSAAEKREHEKRRLLRIFPISCSNKSEGPLPHREHFRKYFGKEIIKIALSWGPPNPPHTASGEHSAEAIYFPITLPFHSFIQSSIPSSGEPRSSPASG